MADWTPSLGALHGKGVTTFRVWAPDHTRAELVTRGTPRALTRDAAGYWSAAFADVQPGDLYSYRLDDADRLMPDPASRYQPQGVHGPSQVIDPSAFEWTDSRWTPPAADRLVFYELHVGTFTPAGTFRAIIDRLPYLRDLGVNAIELMPVADFAGARNWGYDGVALFAPARCYGTPDDLRALVDACHGHGLALFLDVVYNHFGPDGAYAIAFSEHYLTAAHQSPWGRGINVDGPHSEHVRRFLIENATHWVREYHVDGLRLDATHAIQDESDPHFLAELTSTVRAHAPRPVVFVAEDHRNLARMLTPVRDGGWGIDAVWADDLHHQLRVHAAGDRESYYADYSGAAEDIAATIRQGWFFTGQATRAGEPRGTDPAALAPRQFVVCIQNHDQVGNRADGARLNHEVDAATYRALSVLLLLAPETPLLFMGQEWAATSPFLFFTDHHAELGQQVTNGRREEFSAFAAFSDPARRLEIPDPQAAETFAASRLNWREPQQPLHARMLRLYQRTLALRRDAVGLGANSRDAYDARVVDPDTIVVSQGCGYGDGESLLLVVRLSGNGPVRLPVTGRCEVMLTTEDPDVTEDPAPIHVSTPHAQPEPDVQIVFRRPGAIVLRGPRLAP